MGAFDRDRAFAMIDGAAAKFGVRGLVLVVNRDDNQQARAWAWSQPLVTPAGVSALFRSDDGPTRVVTFEEHVRATAANWSLTERGGPHDGRETRFPTGMAVESVTLIDDHRARIVVTCHGERDEFDCEMVAFSGFSLHSAMNRLTQRHQNARLEAAARQAGALSSGVSIVAHFDWSSREVFGMEVRGRGGGVVTVDFRDHADPGGDAPPHVMRWACAVAQHLPADTQVSLVAPTPAVAFLESAGMATRLFVPIDHPYFPTCVRRAAEAFHAIAEDCDRRHNEWLRRVTSRDRWTGCAPSMPC